LSTLVGLNSAINLRLLGVASRIPLASLDSVFPVMWGGLALTAATGVLLFISDATKHASNPAFSVKLVFVALAVAILVAMRKRSGKLLAAASLACWFVALSAGRLMAYIAEFLS
jgi:hypothetical protein